MDTAAVQRAQATSPAQLSVFALDWTSLWRRITPHNLRRLELAPNGADPVRRRISSARFGEPGGITSLRISRPPAGPVGVKFLSPTSTPGIPRMSSVPPVGGARSFIDGSVGSVLWFGARR